MCTLHLAGNVVGGQGLSLTMAAAAIATATDTTYQHKEHDYSTWEIVYGTHLTRVDVMIHLNILRDCTNKFVGSTC